jgi:hypothetical protein
MLKSAVSKHFSLQLMHLNWVGAKRSVYFFSNFDRVLMHGQQDMRQKFEAEDPAEVGKAGQGTVDRSQGAARAISVGILMNVLF